MDNKQIPLTPVTGFTTAPVSAHGAVMIQFHYLTHPTQALGDAHPSPGFVLYAAQAQELIQQIQRTLAALESGPPPGAGLPKH